MGLAPTHSPYPRALTSLLRTRAREATLTLLRDLLCTPQGAPLARDLKGKRAQHEALTARLWREGLTLTYRALCLLTLCARPPQARHAWLLTPEWSARFDPWVALAPLILKSGEGLAARLHELWRHLRTQSPRLDGAIFGEEGAPTLEPLLVSDATVTRWLSYLMWRQAEPLAGEEVEPLPYAKLGLEGLGAVYEGFLQYRLGYASRPMERVRRGEMEVVSPQRQARDQRDASSELRLVECLPRGSLYLTYSLTRKDSGSYYTPPELSQTLASAALAPLLERLSDPLNPHPSQLLKLSVLDPAMGSGHALLAAARALGDALCRSLIACAKADHQEALEEALEEAPSLKRPLETALRGEGPLELERACVACVIERCLYGVDLNPFACALAQLTLWLEAHSEHSISELTRGKLVCGDTLSAPPLRLLFTLPMSGAPLPTALTERLEGQLARALQGEAPLLTAFKRLNAVWVGAVMSEERESATGDEHYLKLCADLSEGALKRFVWRVSRAPLKVLCARGALALPFELTFPKLTYPERSSPKHTSPKHTAQSPLGCERERSFGFRFDGFDVVLGNPPWEKVVASEREFYATRDARVLAAPTARERAPLIERLKRRAEVREAWSRYEAPLRGLRAVVERMYHWQRVVVNRPGEGEGVTLGHGDLYRYFVERSWWLLKRGGRCALLLPNALYASESATGVRRLLLEQSVWRLCLGWVNTRRLFEIGAQQRFCLVAFERAQPSPEHTLCVRFGLTHPCELKGGELERGELERGEFERGKLEGAEGSSLLPVSLALIKGTSPTFLCLLELRSRRDLALITELFAGGETFGGWSAARGVSFYQELNMTLDAPRLTPSHLHTQLDPRREPERGRLWGEGWLTVHEKGTFSAFDDSLKERPRHLCHVSALSASEEGGSLRHKERAREASRHFRVAARAVIHAREEDKAAFTLLPPQCVVTNSALVEREPERRSLRQALTLIGVANSRPFNYVARLRVGTNLNQFLLNALPFPHLSPEEEALIAEGAARLCAQHEAYAPMWREVFGEAWSERCVLSFEERWALRAELDALVAHAYGLSLSAYEHLLRSFEHSEAPYASALCLEAYERLLSEL